MAVMAPSVQDRGVDLWWDGRAGAGRLRGDYDLCGVAMCSLPDRVCQQHWVALHNPLHQVRKVSFIHYSVALKSLFLTFIWTLCPDRSEEQCLVRSGLVQLLDSLCSLSGQRENSSSEKQTKKQKVATMAWAAFQVLANRCIEWEKVEGMLYLSI